jgi:hypothetical protein
VTGGGGPVGVPLPIGDTSAILGSSMTGPDPFLFSEADGGWRRRYQSHGPFPSQHSSRLPSASAALPVALDEVEYRWFFLPQQKMVICK